MRGSLPSKKLAASGTVPVMADPKFSLWLTWPARILATILLTLAVRGVSHVTGQREFVVEEFLSLPVLAVAFIAFGALLGHPVVHTDSPSQLRAQVKPYIDRFKRGQTPSFRRYLLLYRVIVTLAGISAYYGWQYADGNLDEWTRGDLLPQLIRFAIVTAVAAWIAYMSSPVVPRNPSADQTSNPDATS